MKKLLILATPRSGSSALYQAIASNYFEYHAYYEPWSQWNHVQPKGQCLVKSLVNHLPEWSHVVNQYDKVIFISRRDREAGLKSYIQAEYERNFVDKYKPNPNIPEKYGIRDHYMNTHFMLEQVAKNNKIWYYEDLFYNRIEIDKLIRYHGLKIRHADRFYNYFKPQYAYEY